MPTYPSHPGGACLLVLRAHGRGLGVSDLLPGRGDRPARHRRTLSRRSPAKRSCSTATGGRRPRVLLLGALQPLPRRHAARLLRPTSPARSASPCMIKDLATGELLAGPDRRHRLRGGLGRRTATCSTPAPTRPGGPTSCCGIGSGTTAARRRRGAHRARRAVLGRRGRAAATTAGSCSVRGQQADLRVPAAQHRRPRGRHRASWRRAARAWSTTSSRPATGC